MSCIISVSHLFNLNCFRNRAVADYLYQNGYKGAHEQFIQEANVVSFVCHHVTMMRFITYFSRKK